MYMTQTSSPLTATYANHIGYSDITPYEVVRVVSAKTIEIRALRTVALPWERQWVPGGFLGTTLNQTDQEWSFESDPSAPVERIRLTKKGEWRNRNRRFVLANEPVKFYDYNF